MDPMGNLYVFCFFVSIWFSARHLVATLCSDHLAGKMAICHECSSRYAQPSCCLEIPNPRDPITERQRMIGVYNHLLTKVFRFHYHSEKVSQDP